MPDQGGNAPPPQPQAAAPARAQPEPSRGSRKWTLRAAGLVAAVLVGAGTWVALNATALRAALAARNLASAATDEERAKWADTLIGYGEPGVHKLAECLRAGDDPTRAAAVAAFDRYLGALPDDDARAFVASGAVLDTFPDAPDAGKRAVLRLVPVVLKRTGPAHAARCRAVVSEGLKMADAEARVAAARLAIHPDIKLRAELVPLLAAPEPEVRGAALFGIASAVDGEAILNDEELFRWLHDADAGVRRICRDALIARDRSEAEIALGKRLTHPDPNERLKLLLELRYDDDVADPEPWLERLSRDPEPAVRAGAARIAVEVSAARNQSSPVWVGRVADTDQHPTVRFVAGYYRARPAPTGEPVRPVGGP
ncbi:MAG: HEAT repeat domain-containing protein [Planctomycetes bacterium]|nr:HEAT repeat domain-containing protein [Planctomycetota bacterium]